MRVLWHPPAFWHRAGVPIVRCWSSSFRTRTILNRVHEQLTANGDRHGIDAEWLVDNFHIIEDSLREVRRDLPPGYDELLPKLSVPPLVGYPRVYALALALVAHTDSELDETRIARFVRAFQEAAPLTIGELWALPTMLRLVLLENLRRLSEKMIWRWEERRRAEQWAKSAADARLSPVGGGHGQRAGQVVARRFTDLSDPFVVRLLQLLRDQGRRPRPSSTSRTSWPRGAPNRTKCSAASKAGRPPIKSRSATACSACACLSAVDWNAFFEQTSHVEAVLREDPAGIYPRQDFATSDRTAGRSR